MESEDDFEVDWPVGEEPVERGDRTLDLMSLTAREFDIFMAGHASGRASGWDDGYAACEESYAARHRYALEVMRRSGRLDLSPDEILEC